MKKIYLFLLLLSSTPLLRAQSETIVEAPNTIVEQMPSFPGGEAAMMKYIQQNVQYPTTAVQAGIMGTSYVTFVVEKDGTLSDVHTLRGIPNGAVCDEEAVRVIKSMPNWNPGKQNDKVVRVQFNLPIKFTLRNPPPAATPAPSK